MTRRQFGRALLGSLAAANAAAQQRQPNLVVLLADDLGYGDVGCYGSPDVPTPHIDSIARSGIRFTDGYVSCAVCSPSRAALMTGRYQQRFGHEFNTGPAGRDMRERLGLPLTEKLMPQYLKAAGYVTGMVGKWHLGGNPEFHPNSRGFDKYFGFLHGANQFVSKRTVAPVGVSTDDTPDAPEFRDRVQPVLRNREPVQEDRYLTDAFGEEAVSFIERHKDKPFFLYLPFNAVHTPLQATRKYLDRFAGIQDEKHRMLAAMTSAMDDAIGRVLETLMRYRLDQNTLVVFSSDNGCPTYTKAGSNGPLNGSKITYYEGGIRVPFLMKWPGGFKGGQVYSKPVTTRDLLPTFLAAAGAPAADRDLDGVNLLPFLSGKQKGAPHARLFWRSGRNGAIRQGDWKLLILGGDQPRYRLYDLAKDIGEKQDQSGRRPEIVKELRLAYEAWSGSMGTPKWEPRGTPTIPVNGEPITWQV